MLCLYGKDFIVLLAAETPKSSKKLGTPSTERKVTWSRKPIMEEQEELNFEEEPSLSRPSRSRSSRGMRKSATFSSLPDTDREREVSEARGRGKVTSHVNGIWRCSVLWDREVERKQTTCF